MIKHLSWATGC